VSALPKLPAAPADETNAALDLAEEKAGPAKLLCWALGRMGGSNALESVQTALDNEHRHRERLADCVDAIHCVLGEAILKSSAGGSEEPEAPAANDDEVSLAPRDRELKTALERRLHELDKDLTDLEDVRQHEEDGTNAVLAAMDDRSAKLIRKRMVYAGRGSVRAMVRVRRERLMEERAKVRDRLTRLLTRAKDSSADCSFAALATIKRGGVAPEPIEIGRKMAAQARRYAGGDVVERRLRAVRRMQEESVERTRSLEEVRKRLGSEAEASGATAP